MADIIRLKAHIKEHIVRKLFVKEGYRLFSPDWMLWNDDELISIEVKNKSMPYVKSIKKDLPFEKGHGLNYNQVKNYRKLKEKGIRTILIVFDQSVDLIYYQYIDVLDKGNKYYSEFSKILVYDLDSYEVYENGFNQMG